MPSTYNVHLDRCCSSQKWTEGIRKTPAAYVAENQARMSEAAGKRKRRETDGDESASDSSDSGEEGAKAAARKAWEPSVSLSP